MTQTTPTTSSAVAADRQRRRPQRQPGPAPEQGRPRLPSAQGGRRPARIAIAVLLIVGGAVAAALLAVRLDERAAVLVFRQPVPAGQQITRDDLAQTQVASDSDLQLVPAHQADEVVGRYAVTAVARGQLVIPTIITAEEPLLPGDEKVGARLAPGRVPVEGLEEGDIVKLVRVADGVAGEILAERALVTDVPTEDGGGGIFGGGSSGSSDGFDVTFAVPSDRSAAVAAAAAVEDLVAILVSRGEPLGTGQ